MSVSDQGEAADKETKELQPIKHDSFRGQQGDKTSFSPAAPYRPPEGSGHEQRGHWRLMEQKYSQKVMAGRLNFFPLTFKENELV